MFVFEGKGNILAKIVTEKRVGHGPPVPPCSYTYEHNGDIRHKQMYVHSTPFNLARAGTSLFDWPEPQLAALAALAKISAPFGSPIHA